MALTIIITYLAVLVVLGLWARRSGGPGPEGYFLAGRRLSPGLTLMTLAATNFSAFTVFGFSGQGYAIGFQFYPQIAVGTGLMAVMFLILGLPAAAAGRRFGLVTPSELLWVRYRSRLVQGLSFLVMLAFTLPYLAMQPMAAGYALETLLGLPYRLGATLIVVVMVLYTFRSGLRGVVLTDALQGLMVPLLLGVVLVVLLVRGGGMDLFASVSRDHPSLFARGGEGGYLPGIWIGYMLLWIWADPMFPQLFQRYYAAGGSRALVLTAWAYPIVTGVLFLLPVMLGVIARNWIPALPEGAAPERILPLLLSTVCPGVLEALVLAAGLAALMSTMDSQLLTLSSMLTRDILEPLSGRKAPVWAGKLLVVLLASAGLLLSFRPPVSFMHLARESFTGLAALLPVYLGAVYWRRASAAGALCGLLAGIILTMLYHLRILTIEFTLPVVPVVLGTTAVFWITSLLLPGSVGSLPAVVDFPWKRLAGPAVLFLACSALSLSALPEGTALGIPWWVWASAAICGLAAVAIRDIGGRSAARAPAE